MASMYARSGAHKDDSDNDYEHSHEDTSDSNEEFASASEGDDDLPWEPVVVRSPAISRASPIVPSTPIVPLAPPKDTQQQQQQQHHHHHHQQETRVYPPPHATIHHKQEAPENHYHDHHTSHGHFNPGSSGHTTSTYHHTQSQSYHHSSSSSSLSQTSPSTISRGTPKLRERMRQSPVPYSKIVQAYLDPTTQLQSPEHVRMAWLQDQQESRQDSSEDDEDSHESKVTHQSYTYPTTHQTRTQTSQIRQQATQGGASTIHPSTSITSQSVHAIAPHRNPPSAYLTTRTHATETTITEKTSSINSVPVEEGGGWGFDDEEIEEMTENKETHAKVITDQHPEFEAPAVISINLDEGDDPEASWGFDDDISLPTAEQLSPLAQDAIVPQGDTYPHIHNVHEADDDRWGPDDQGIDIAESAIRSERAENVIVPQTHTYSHIHNIHESEGDDGWGYGDQGIDNAESAIQSEIAENTKEHAVSPHTWNNTVGQSISGEEEDAWGIDLQEVNITGTLEKDVLVPPPVSTSVSITFGFAQTESEVEDAWDDESNIDIGDNNLDTSSQAPQEEILEDNQDNELDITTQDISGNELVESLPVEMEQDSHYSQRSSFTSEGAIDEASWGFDTDDIETPVHEHVHSNEEHNLEHATQHVSPHLQDDSHLMHKEQTTVSTSIEPGVHFDNHTAMDSKGQAELVISGFDDIEENEDAWGQDDPIMEAQESIAEPAETTAPVDLVQFEHIHEVAQPSIEEAAQSDEFEDHHHDTRDHISNGSDNEHDNEVREVLMAVQTSSFIGMEGPELSLGTGPSSRSSHQMDSVDVIPVDHHVQESKTYNSLDNATGEQLSGVAESIDSDSGSDIYNDLSTARAGMNASSNRLNEILDDDDYLEHMERGVPMNRSISTPYSDDESSPKFVVEDELVELMERGERPLLGQHLAHPSEESEAEEVDTQEPLEHGVDGSNLATSFGAALEFATKASDVTSTSEKSENVTMTTSTDIDTILTSSTELEPVETAHLSTLIDVFSEVPESQSIEIEELVAAVESNAVPLKELLAQPDLEETVAHEEQPDVSHGSAPFGLHELDHQISLDVTVDGDDAWMDQDIQIAVDAKPHDTVAEIAESEIPFAVLDAGAPDGASKELQDDVQVQESHNNIVVQEYSEQSRPSSFKIGSIVKRLEQEQVQGIVEDAWGWDEQEVEVDLEIQKETPLVQSEEQNPGGQSPSPSPSHVYDNEFSSDPIVALFEKSPQDILFDDIEAHTAKEILPRPTDLKPFDVDDFFKDLETPTTSTESTRASHMVDDMFSKPLVEVQDVQLDEKATSETAPPSTQEPILSTSVASPFKALEPGTEDQDYEDDGGAWDDEAAWPDFAPKIVGDDKSSDEAQSLEGHTVMDEFNELDARKDHGALEIETNVLPTPIHDVPQEEPALEADQWDTYSEQVENVVTVDTFEHVHDHTHGHEEVEPTTSQENVLEEHVHEEHTSTVTDPWDEEIVIDGLPVDEETTEPSHVTDLIGAPVPSLSAINLAINDVEGNAWMEDIEGPSKVSDVSTAVVVEQLPVSNSSILSVLDDAIGDQAQGWGFDEDLAEEPIHDFREIVNSELSVPGTSAPVANALSPHDRLFSDDIHHLSTVASTLESRLSAAAPAFKTVSSSTTVTSSFEHHAVHTEEHAEEEEEDAWDNDVNILEETTKAHTTMDTVEPEDDENGAWGDNVDDAALQELAKSRELTAQAHDHEDSWDHGDAGLEDLEKELEATVASQAAEPIELEIAPAREDISVSSHAVHEAAPEVDIPVAGNFDISAEALDDKWGFDMDDAPLEQTLSSQHSDLNDQSTPTPLDAVSLPKKPALPEIVSPVTAQKEQQVVTAEQSEEEDGLSPWQDVSPQSASKRSDAAMSLGSEFESEYSVRSMDDEERTSPAPSHIHERSIDSSSSAAGHSTTRISTTMSWTDLNEDEWQDEDTDITQELLHSAEAKTTSVSALSHSANIGSAVQTSSVKVQELPDLSGADSWDFDQDDLESEESSTYMDKTPLASKFDMTRHTKTPDMSEQRSILQHKTSFTSATPSPGHTLSSYQSSLAGSVPPSPSRPVIAPSTSSGVLSTSSVSGNLGVDASAEAEDDSHLPLAIRQQRARLAARGKPLPPISKYKSTKDQADKPASSEAPTLSPRLSGATSPVISFTSPVGAKSPVISATTVSTVDQKYLSPALQKQRERLEKKRAAAAATASAPLSAARRLTVGEPEQAVNPPSPLIAKALPSLNKVSPIGVRKVEATFESLSSTSVSGLSPRLMNPTSPSPVEESRHRQQPQQHESPALSSRARRSSNTPTSPVQRSSFSVTSPTPSSPLADGFVRRSRDSHWPIVASGLEAQETDVVRTSQSEVYRHASRSSVSKTVLSSGWDNTTEDKEEPVVEDKKASRMSGTSFFKSSTVGGISSQKEPESIMDRPSPFSSSASGFYQQSVPGLDHDGKDESIGSKSAFGIQTTSDEDPYGPASARSRKAKSSFEGSSFDRKEGHEEGTLIGSASSPSVSIMSPTGAKSMSHRHDHHSSNNNNSYLGGSNSLLGDITSIMNDKKYSGGSSNNHKSDDHHDSDKRKTAASNASLSTNTNNQPKSSSWSFGSWVSSAVAVATEQIDKAYETLDPEYSRIKARGGSSVASDGGGGLEEHYGRKPGYVVGGSSLALGLASISTTGNGAPVSAGGGSSKTSMSVERTSQDYAVTGSGSDAHVQHISHGHGHGHGFGSPGQQASPRLTRKNVGDSR
ncbi:hypothetical protein MVEG_03493 [Podila verticillata NRRL 6337]|nr:hypothetical protein MVEG_03493 [Podila verticillata NRRL 6337]